jgi:hypothetical protein
MREGHRAQGSLMGDAAGIERMRPIRFSPSGPGRGESREAERALTLRPLRGSAPTTVDGVPNM